MNPLKRKEKGKRGTRADPPTNAFPVGWEGGPGRPKDDPEFIDACRSRTMKALGVLDKAMDGFAEAPAVAVKAAEVMLNRGWGTAPATIKLDVKGDVKSTSTVVVTPMDPEKALRIFEVLRRSGAFNQLAQAQAGVAQAEAPKVEET